MAAGVPHVSRLEVSRHSSPGNCWIIIRSQVYDVSRFLSEHPGGAGIILRYAGRDATAAYDEIHAPGIAEENLSEESLMGVLDPNDQLDEQTSLEPTNLPVSDAAQSTGPPSIESLISVHDFEDIAQQVLTAKAYAFYSSAATDLVTQRANIQVWRDLLLRPRVLRDVSQVSIKRKILGCESDAPFFVSPAAMARLAHPEGELALARGCGQENIIQTISNNASYPLSDIVKAGNPGQPFFFQLYVNSERQKTEQLLAKVKSLGIKAIFVTVDAPIPGKREADERLAAGNLASAVSGAVAVSDKKGGGLGRVMAKYIDSSLNWSDLAWLKRASGGLPIVLKGVQTAADAKKATEYPVDAILLSNHGGRSLDTVQTPMWTLLEIHKQCPEVLEKLEVYVDGGISRGADILKALALGATAVGIGRPYLYSLVYGQEGVEHLTQILKDELESAMKLSGITDIDEAHPGMVNTSTVEQMVRSTEEHPWIKWKPKAKL